jgi:hypothetical protein
MTPQRSAGLPAYGALTPVFLQKIGFTPAARAAGALRPTNGFFPQCKDYAKRGK